MGNNSKSHQLRLVVQLALEVVEIKQTTTRLEINSEKKYFREKRNRRWDAFISEQSVCPISFFKANNGRPANSNTLFLGHEGPGCDVAIVVKVGHHNAEGWVGF